MFALPCCRNAGEHWLSYSSIQLVHKYSEVFEHKTDMHDMNMNKYEYGCYREYLQCTYCTYIAHKSTKQQLVARPVYMYHRLVRLDVYSLLLFCSRLKTHVLSTHDAVLFTCTANLGSIDLLRSERSAVFLASGASRSVGALPGVHVRAYASGPTRDNRAEAADRAAQARAKHAQKTAAKLQQDRRTTTMLTSRTAQNEDTPDKVDNIVQELLSSFGV